MVLATCRRILGHGPDADDAYQATFLVLARYASRIGNGNALPGWLHRVATRVAGKARSANFRQSVAPLPDRIPDVRTVDPANSAGSRELAQVLDEELDQLPERFRSVVVLCCLEGCTSGEAARSLGCPQGTVDSRLATAKRKLRDRLTRRGIVPGLAATALAAIPSSTATAALVPATVDAAVQLANHGTGSGPAFFLANGVYPMSNLIRVRLTLAFLLISGVGAYLALAAPVPGDRSKQPENSYPARFAKSKLELAPGNAANRQTEQAIATGLHWLRKQQKKNGSWEFDGLPENQVDPVAGTGLALLPFLGAGATHKADGQYRQTVADGIQFLVKSQKKDGSFEAARTTTAHCFATIALCEAHDLTGDKNLLEPALLATDHLIKKQNKNGGWNNTPAGESDVSTTSWACMVMRSDLQSSLVIPETTLRSTSKFLDTHTNKLRGIYREKPDSPTSPAATAAALTTRLVTDQWDGSTRGMQLGVAALYRDRPTPQNFDAQFCFLGSLLLHRLDRKDRAEFWSTPTRELLLKTQTPDNEAGGGSWDPDTSNRGYGRLGTTCFNLLTLEVYFRHLGLFRR